MSEHLLAKYVRAVRNRLSPGALQLVTRDTAAAEDSVISVHANDVESAYEEAQELGYKIGKTDEYRAVGVHRSFVRAPDGNVINIVNHRD